MLVISVLAETRSITITTLWPSVDELAVIFFAFCTAHPTRSAKKRGGFKNMMHSAYSHPSHLRDYSARDDERITHESAISDDPLKVSALAKRLTANTA